MKSSLPELPPESFTFERYFSDNSWVLTGEFPPDWLPLGKIRSADLLVRPRPIGWAVLFWNVSDEYTFWQHMPEEWVVQ